MNYKFIIPLIIGVSCSIHSLAAESIKTKEIFQLSGQSKLPLTGIKQYSNQFLIGFEDRKIPIEVKWKAGLNKNNCLIIDEVKIFQPVANTKLNITKINAAVINKAENDGCVLEMDQKDDIRFQIIHLSMEYKERKWFKTYESKGAIGQIQGNGNSCLE
ncbi:hypothetical protein KTJ32_19575 [Acinetobacter gyllenbergii]|uniref:hypothetical protein n=1 Tax=Acinetobacter gyllenbergii TaxID=134534 RepID=UPI0021D385C1|nr:hypothetical protein [Acinetobacter gyllenbergii]MCU4583195.1 hypothetical protein [Acinetobacter gyllenbergii]